MDTTKLFVNGQSQAVWQPKQCRFTDKEGYIQKLDNTRVLSPKEQAWGTFLDGLNDFTNDFLENGRFPEVQVPREVQ